MVNFQKISKDTLTTLLIFISALIILVIAYSPILGWFFARDDFGFLPHLPTTLANIPAILTPPRYWFFRPLSQQFYFWINSVAWGLNPLGFRLVGLVMLALNTTLIYKLIRRFSSNYVAIAGTIFYGLNTIHLFEIGWIAANYQTMSTLLFLMTLLLATTTQRKCRLLSYFTLILAFLCSEMSIFIAPIIFIYNTICSGGIHDAKLMLTIRRTFLKTLPFILLTIAYLAFYFWYVQLPGGSVYGRLFDPISVIKTLGKYILYPFVAGFDRTNIFGIVNLLLASKLIIIAAAMFLTIKNKLLDKKMILFGSGLFIITVSIFTLLGNHTFAYLDAIPTIGITILVAATFECMTVSKRLSKIVLATFFVLSFVTLILAQKTDPDLAWLNNHQQAAKEYLKTFKLPENKEVALNKNDTNLMEATYFGNSIEDFFKEKEVKIILLPASEMQSD